MELCSSGVLHDEKGRGWNCGPAVVKHSALFTIVQMSHFAWQIYPEQFLQELRRSSPRSVLESSPRTFLLARAKLQLSKNTFGVLVWRHRIGRLFWPNSWQSESPECYIKCYKPSVSSCPSNFELCRYAWGRLCLRRLSASQHSGLSSAYILIRL